MKSALILLVSISVAAFAADNKRQAAKNPPAQQDQQEQQVKKLGSVTWDVDQHKLVWVVQKGTMVNGEFVPSGEERYEISPDEATMANAGEKRGFEEDEATTLRHLLDVLSVYCAESVVWWDEGQGKPVESRPGAKPPENSGKKAVKVGEPQQKKPVYKVPATDLVAWAQ
jgi:hypothetical protein